MKSNALKLFVTVFDENEVEIYVHKNLDMWQLSRMFRWQWQDIKSWLHPAYFASTIYLLRIYHKVIGLFVKIQLMQFDLFQTLLDRLKSGQTIICKGIHSSWVPKGTTNHNWARDTKFSDICTKPIFKGSLSLPAPLIVLPLFLNHCFGGCCCLFVWKNLVIDFKAFQYLLWNLLLHQVLKTNFLSIAGSNQCSNWVLTT